MTEIERLYKNAGINATARTKKVRQNLFECGLFCPDFTAEKQLELIKWLAKLDGHFEISCTYNKEAYSFSFYFNRKTEKHKNPTFPYSIMNGSDFIELLAKQVNELWQSLTTQE